MLKVQKGNTGNRLALAVDSGKLQEIIMNRATVAMFILAKYELGLISESEFIATLTALFPTFSGSPSIQSTKNEIYKLYLTI